MKEKTGKPEPITRSTVLQQLALKRALGLVPGVARAENAAVLVEPDAPEAEALQARARRVRQALDDQLLVLDQDATVARLEELIGVEELRASEAENAAEELAADLNRTQRELEAAQAQLAQLQRAAAPPAAPAQRPRRLPSELATACAVELDWRPIGLREGAKGRREGTGADLPLEARVDLLMDTYLEASRVDGKDLPPVHATRFRDGLRDGLTRLPWFGIGVRAGAAARSNGELALMSHHNRVDTLLGQVLNRHAPGQTLPEDQAATLRRGVEAGLAGTAPEAEGVLDAVEHGAGSPGLRQDLGIEALPVPPAPPPRPRGQGKKKNSAPRRAPAQQPAPRRPSQPGLMDALGGAPAQG